MGKLSEVAARIRETKQRLDAEADELAAKVDIIDHKAPKIYAAGHAIIETHNADLDEMDKELRALSNLEH